MAATTILAAPIELIAATGATMVLTRRSAVRALNRNIGGIMAGSVGISVTSVNSALAEHISFRPRSVDAMTPHLQVRLLPQSALAAN